MHIKMAMRRAWVMIILVCGLAVMALAAAPVQAAISLTTLLDFNNTNGATPYAGLIADNAGNLYGTTYGGGINNVGTVFKLAIATKTLTTLAAFDTTHGANPEAGLLADSAGNLYGTTYNGGANNYGTVFEVAAGTNTLSTLVTFNNANGEQPHGTLIADSAGNMYGTTLLGGSGYGTVFEVAAGTNALTTLVTFDNAGGAYPLNGLVADSLGNLYGTTANGGPSNTGTVFKVAAGTNALSTLATFIGSNGANPHGITIDRAGNLFVTSSNGAVNGYGAVTRIAAGTNAVSTLATFDGTSGVNPVASLIADSAGNLYGTTQYTGPGHVGGTVFKIAAGTNQFSTLATFFGTNGNDPYGGLIADSAGNLYGTTEQAGANNAGTIFKLSGTGFVTPEPATLGLVASGGLLLLRRTSRRQAVGRGIFVASA